MKKILMVEDDQRSTIVLSARLKAMGYEVTTAHDLVSAITAARKSEPNVVLIDVNEPGADGLLVARRLQVCVQSAFTPMVFISANQGPEVKEQAMKLGAVACLDKPLHAADLVQAIEDSYRTAVSL